LKVPGFFPSFAWLAGHALGYFSDYRRSLEGGPPTIRCMRLAEMYA
jgi:hypothetical protein